MLRLENVSAGYGAGDVLQDVSLEVSDGEMVAIIGANGAGKSTLLKTISSILPCREGRIWFEGSDITELPPEEVAGAGLVQVPEGRRIFGAITVDENLRIGTYASRKRLDSRGIVERQHLVFDLFPVLRERLSQRAGTLSGGEQQMLAVARALMSDPKLLLMDEPSLGLAPLLADAIFSTLATLNKQGITIVLVEQNALRALRLAHRGYLMDVGRIVLHAAANDLLRDPRVKDVYLGELATNLPPEGHSDKTAN